MHFTLIVLYSLHFYIAIAIPSKTIEISRLFSKAMQKVNISPESIRCRPSLPSKGNVPPAQALKEINAIVLKKTTV